MVALESILVPSTKCQYREFRGRRLRRSAALRCSDSSHSSRPFFYVVSACCIRLRANESTVGVERHAPRIGEFDPHPDKCPDTSHPLWRIDPGKQTEITGNHQPLNVVGVAVVEELMMAFLATHVDFPVRNNPVTVESLSAHCARHTPAYCSSRCLG